MGNSNIPPRAPLNIHADNSTDDNLPIIVSPAIYCAARLVCRHWYAITNKVFPPMLARRTFIRRVVGENKTYYIMPNGKKHGNSVFSIPHDDFGRMPIAEYFYLGDTKLYKNFHNGYKNHIVGNEKIYHDLTLSGAVKNVIKYRGGKGHWTTIKSHNGYKIQIVIRQDHANNYSYVATNDVEMILEEIPMCDPGRSLSHVNTFRGDIYTSYMGDSIRYRYLLVGRLESRVILLTAYNTSMIYRLAENGVAAAIRDFAYDSPVVMLERMTELANQYSWDTTWLTQHYENEIWDYENKMGDYAEFDANHFKYEMDDMWDRDEDAKRQHENQLEK